MGDSWILFPLALKCSRHKATNSSERVVTAKRRISTRRPSNSSSPVSAEHNFINNRATVSFFIHAQQRERCLSGGTPTHKHAHTETPFWTVHPLPQHCRADQCSVRSGSQVVGILLAFQKPYTGKWVKQGSNFSFQWDHLRITTCVCCTPTEATAITRSGTWRTAWRIVSPH